MNDVAAKTAEWSGLPPNPALPDYHWLLRDGDTAPQPAAWSVRPRGWVLLNTTGHLQPEFIARRFRYAGLCPRPALERIA